jgi:hypothetical protein
MSQVAITLIGRDACHLCDDALPIVEEVVGAFSNVTLTKARVEDQPGWVELYSDKVPVVLVDSLEHCHWHVKREELHEAVQAAGGLLLSQDSG